MDIQENQSYQKKLKFGKPSDGRSMEVHTNKKKGYHYFLMDHIHSDCTVDHIVFANFSCNFHYSDLLCDFVLAMFLQSS